MNVGFHRCISRAVASWIILQTEAGLQNPTLKRLKTAFSRDMKTTEMSFLDGHDDLKMRFERPGFGWAFLYCPDFKEMMVPPLGLEPRTS